MLELEQALERILERIPAPASERVPLIEADGRILAATATSPIDLPLFDNSSMDGYAVRAADLAEATRKAPVELKLAGRAVAGEAYGGEVAAGCCVRLFTGSALPRGADAVVMQEDTSVEPARPGAVRFLGPVAPRENVRYHGEDVRAGETLFKPGARLRPAQIALLAACGLGDIAVGRRPAVALLATGSELREPGETLAPGQIYESNRSALAGLVRKAGAVPRVLPIVPDTFEGTVRALQEGFSGADAVITSGGVSVGEMDLVKRAFEAAGGDLEFWRVAMKPGRPFVFGRLGQKLLFGLPGNPVSAFVTFLLMVRPALLKWQGAADLRLPAHPARLAEAIENPGNRRHFVRVRVDDAGQARSAGEQASHILGGLARANALLELKPGQILNAGTIVQVLRF